MRKEEPHCGKNERLPDEDLYKWRDYFAGIYESYCVIALDMHHYLICYLH